MCDQENHQHKHQAYPDQTVPERDQVCFPVRSPILRSSRVVFTQAITPLPRPQERMKTPNRPMDPTSHLEYLSRLPVSTTWTWFSNQMGTLTKFIYTWVFAFTLTSDRRLIFSFKLIGGTDGGRSACDRKLNFSPLVFTNR